jgi:hypothetical protein
MKTDTGARVSKLISRDPRRWYDGFCLVPLLHLCRYSVPRACSRSSLILIPTRAQPSHLVLPPAHLTKVVIQHPRLRLPAEACSQDRLCTADTEHAAPDWKSPREAGMGAKLRPMCRDSTTQICTSSPTQKRSVELVIILLERARSP